MNSDAELITWLQLLTPMMSNTQEEVVLAAADRLAALIAERDRLAAALKPWAFLDAPRVRCVFTDAPGSLYDARFKGEVVMVVSGPWLSHMDCPDLDQAVAEARAAINPTQPKGDAA